MLLSVTNKFSIMIFVMLNVIKLSVVVLSVMAPASNEHVDKFLRLCI